VTSSINNFTSSQLGIDFGIGIVTSSLNDFTSSQLGIDFGIGIVTSSLNNFTSSQLTNNSNLAIYTSSINDKISDIQSYTASLKTAIVVTGADVEVLGKLKAKEVYTSYVTSSVLLQSGSTKFGDTVDDRHEFTGSIYTNENIVVGGLNVGDSINQIISQTSSINYNLGSIQTFTSSQLQNNSTLANYTTSLNYNVTQIQSFTSSQLGIDFGIAIVTSSINNFTSSQLGIDFGIGIVTSSLNDFTSSQLGIDLNAMLFGFFDGSAIYGPYYQIFGKDYASLNQRGSAEFVFDSRNGGDNGFNVVELNNVNWYRKFRVSTYGAEVTGSFNVTDQIKSVGITASLLATNSVVSGSQQILDYNLFALTASNNTFYGENTFTNKVTHTNGYIVLAQVSQSLNFVDDAAAALGGVPLGGLYRNGNFIAIRIA